MQPESNSSKGPVGCKRPRKDGRFATGMIVGVSTKGPESKDTASDKSMDVSALRSQAGKFTSLPAQVWRFGLPLNS